MIFDYDFGNYVPSDEATIEIFCKNLIEERNKRLRPVIGYFKGQYVVIGLDDTLEDVLKKHAMNERELKRNASGYYDPTAYNAIKKVDSERYCSNNSDSERFHKLIGCIYRMCELSGFYAEERIVLKDKRTGKVWR